MNLRLKDRWEIYWNGNGGVKHLTKEFGTNWKYIMPVCGKFAESLVQLLIDTVRVVGCLLLPLLVWTVPVIAIFTARRYLTDEEVRARMRRELHINGVEK